MKNFILLMLSLFTWGAASVSAQVKIGPELNDPHEGAVLDLESPQDYGFKQGLLLPRVDLFAANQWYPLAGSAVEGMIVYNTTTAEQYGLSGIGVYVWAEGAWVKISGGGTASREILTAGISLNTNELELPLGGNPIRLTSTVLPENATNKTVIWTSDDERIATVDENGRVSPVAIGTAIITATTQEGGHTDNCTVNVINVTIPVASIELNPTVASVRATESITIIPTITPAEASIKEVIWTSSKPDIAIVSEAGVVTGITPGAATITAITTDGGLMATCDITVTGYYPFGLESRTPADGSIIKADGVNWVILHTDENYNMLIISEEVLYKSIYATANLGGDGSDYWRSECLARQSAEDYYNHNLYNLKYYAQKVDIKIEDSWTAAGGSGILPTDITKQDAGTGGLSVVNEELAETARTCFLPSICEMQKYLFGGLTTVGQYRLGKGADSEYWLRSPSPTTAMTSATKVNNKGVISYPGLNHTATDSKGVRLCMWINISGGTNPSHDISRD